jgi:hypothetical protein
MRLKWPTSYVGGLAAAGVVGLLALWGYIREARIVSTGHYEPWFY